MANFEVDFQIKGVGEVTLPVTPLDELILAIDGLVIKTFRFTVQNILARDITFNMSVATAGAAATKVSVGVDQPTVSIPAGGSVQITATVTPSAPLVEGDEASVSIVGTEAV